MRRAASTIVKEYTYTVVSNCAGGTVLFDGVSMGSISGGKFAITIPDGKVNYTVTISGGVPGSGNNTSTEYTTEYHLSGGANQNYGSDGGFSSFVVDSSARDASRVKYDPYSYSGPGSAVVGRDSQVTMNYSGPSYGTPTYGSWSYGGWYWVLSSWQYNDPKWVSRTYTTSSINTTWNFQCTANTSSARSDYDFLTQSNSGNQIRIDFSQAAYVPPPSYTYTVYSNCIGGTVYFDGGSVGTINSSGYYQKTIVNGDTYYNVTIRGGYPGNSYSDWVYTLNRSTSIISSGFPAAAGNTGNVTTASSRTRNEYWHGEPSALRVSRDSSVTMNATGGTRSQTEYVSWYHNSIPSWLSYTTTKYGTNASATEEGYYTFAANSGASRTHSVTILQNNSGKTFAATATQIAGTSYVFSTSRSDSPHSSNGSYTTVNTKSYAQTGSTIGARMPWSWRVALPSWITAKYTIIDNNTSSSGTTDVYTAAANTTSAARSFAGVMVQNNTGKTLNMNFVQAGATFTVTGTNSGTYSCYITKNGETAPTSSNYAFDYGAGGVVVSVNTPLSRGTYWTPGNTLQFYSINGGIMRLLRTATVNDKTIINL